MIINLSRDAFLQFCKHPFPLLLLAHRAFKPKMSLCHRVASVVCRVLSIHNSQEMQNVSPPSILIRFKFCLVCLKELGPVQ